ncbi:ecto-ADP-ribosyltransferase 5-like [Rhinichthys klamathensis goyatoka]|uniref:ecto-ADP-ribosyltransferase 5-like n=1 Tax=Rhinichthys klamathensis goyatoka TaxID=3034132 RepID=UPI0024B4EE70|nr:ecto-ADP-ribosyltransferase 5-like [Rhinichthys klamathensis goyatoka]
MAMMVVLAAVLLTYGVSTGIAMEAGTSSAVAGENSVLPLDMAENSVDDMYYRCKDQMKKRVSADLEDEKNKDQKFKKVWESSNDLRNFKEGTHSLRRDQIVAISYYTSGEDNAYLDFNTAVRTQGPQYETTFRYHALHFLLTTAIQDERAFEEKLRNTKYCLTGYRRVNRYFSQPVINTQFRFGSFTSATLNKLYPNKELFGEKSCFQIETCMGVDVSIYSKFEDAEAEVLIPPYEVFEVVEIKKRLKSELPCEVVYIVKSTKTPVSKLDCSLFPNSA